MPGAGDLAAVAYQAWLAVGFEHPSDSPMIPAISEQNGAESGALCLTDPDLALVIDAWAFLPDAMKAGILAMVRAARG